MKMKSIFKKAISVLCAAAVVATCFSMTAFAEVGDNVALTATFDTDFNRTTDRLNDGKALEHAYYRGTQAGNTHYVTYYWGDAVTIKDFVIYYRDAHNYAADKDKYTVSISTDTTNGKDGIWTPVDITSAVRQGPDKSETIFGDHFAEAQTNNNVAKDTFSLVNAASVKGVKIEMVATNTQIQIYELEVYEAAAAAEVPSFKDVEQYESVNGEYKDMLILANIDEEEVAGKTIKATFTITREGVEAPAVDTIELDTAWKSVTVNGDEIVATDLGGTADQYVTGFILRELLADDTVTVEFSVE